jgi:hypothetical protein
MPSINVGKHPLGFPVRFSLEKKIYGHPSITLHTSNGITCPSTSSTKSMSMENLNLHYLVTLNSISWLSHPKNMDEDVHAPPIQAFPLTALILNLNEN